MFAGVLTAYSAALQEIEGSLAFFEKANALKPKSGPIFASPHIDGYTKQLVKDFYDSDPFNEVTVYRALIVLMCGSYESFVRSLVGDAAGEISSRKGKFDDLNQTFVKHHQRQSGLVLAGVFEPRDHHRFDYFQISKNLGTCYPATTTWSINKDAFSLYDGSLNAEGLSNLLNRLGMKLDWKVVAESPGFRGYEGIPKAGRRANRISETLDIFVKLRNDAAHTGVGGISVTNGEIRSYLAYLELLGQALSKTIEDYIVREH